MLHSNLNQFAYISHQTQDFSEENLRKLLILARKKNKEMKLTGLLLFDKPYFFQVLEGPADAIELMRKTLELDKRHKNMDVIYFNNNLFEREFSRWNMGAKILGSGLPSDYKELDERVKSILKASKANGEIAHELLLDFRNMSESYIDI